MPDEKNRKLNEILALMVLAAAVAVLTYPLLQILGINAILIEASMWCSKAIFIYFGIPM